MNAKSLSFWVCTMPMVRLGTKNALLFIQIREPMENIYEKNSPLITYLIYYSVAMELSK